MRSLRTGLHTVTIQMRKPSRFVPLMIAVGIGAFGAFGWPVIAWTQGPHVDLNDASLSQLVAVHRGSASQESLENFTDVKALVLFEALPTRDSKSTQGSFVVLRASRVVSSRTIAKALDVSSKYQVSLSGTDVQVRRQGEAIHVLIGSDNWPVVQLPGAPSL